MEMENEGRNRDIRKLARMNVLRTSARTSKRGPNADVSGCPQNVRQQTLQIGPNPDVLQTSTSERYKADRFSIVYDTCAAPAAEGAAQKLSERRGEEMRGGAEYSSPLPNEADKEEKGKEDEEKRAKDIVTGFREGGVVFQKGRVQVRGGVRRPHALPAQRHRPPPPTRRFWGITRPGILARQPLRVRSSSGPAGSGNSSCGAGSLFTPSWTHEDTSVHARGRDRSPEERRARHFNSGGDEASFTSGVPHHTPPDLDVSAPLLLPHAHSRREPGEGRRLPTGHSSLRARWARPVPAQAPRESFHMDSDRKILSVSMARKVTELKQGVEKIFERLHLKGKTGHELRAADLLEITEYSSKSNESCAEVELVQTFLQKLLMMNYTARYIKIEQIKNQHITPQRQTDIHEDDGDIFKELSFSNEVMTKTDGVHTMDVQMAVFHCADSFLKQLMVTKLSQCQYALPLLVPDPFTRQIEFPLWTFRQINKSWKMRNTNNEIISQNQPIYKTQTPMVSFFRFGSISLSKSQLMNSLINEKHNTFFHRNCPGSSRTRVLMDGVVEIAWFFHSGKDTDKFTDCVAFCNLHGDAGDHEKQLQILTEMASVNVVLLPQIDRNDRSIIKVQELYKDSKPLICLFTEEVSNVTEARKGKYKIGLKDRNQSDVSEELIKTINDCLSKSFSTFRLEDVSKFLDIRLDEEYDDDCRRGREAAQQMVNLLKNKNLTEIKESFLPHQGKLWHQWCQKNKELHRPQGNKLEIEMNTKRTEMKKLREQQHETDISVFLKFFINEINLHVANKMYFLKWLRILLDEHTSADLSALHDKYDEKWSAVVTLKEGHANCKKLTAEQNELDRISEDLQAAAFGLEHIMREISQIYESCSSVNKNKKELQFHFSSLPSLAAEMMISGFPLELMDGDAVHVPLVWISAVLDQLIQKLGDQRVFVLSVLGIQSSGKSTMLNAMFGLQFAVSAGRCTRGAFMQLIRVSDEMKTQMNVDYILVVDTEGLRALELAGRSTRNHDNELATFVVGLGNLTLINIFGENPTEMQDILQIVVQAFMRMKKVRLNPSCVFVHQNVSDITAGEKNMEGRRRLKEKLDEMTKLAAEEVCNVECFSDVISFDVRKDVKYLSQLWEGSPPMAPPNPTYCENIQQLKDTIISHISNSYGMMLTDLKAHINNLWEALLNERFIFSFRNSLEISAYRKVEREYSKWSWTLRSAMMETQNKLHNKIESEAIHEVEETDLQEELKRTSEEIKKSLSEFFEKDTDAEIVIQWKTTFEIKIKELQENIVRKTKRKLNEILQLRELKKKINAHENTVLEKCKELALKLKDKSNDEETLKREFDSFWEQSMKNIVTDTPAIKDIDMMRDVQLLLNDVYESNPVEHSRVNRDIVSVPSYTDYVQLKKTCGFTAYRGVKSTIRAAREKLGFLNNVTLSPEDEAQIRSFVTDIAQQTKIMIQSFNISKIGYNISFIQQLTDYIKARVIQHQEGPVKYLFKNDFFMDLVLSICKRAHKMVTDQHRKFREANDPVIYVENKREEYYSIFQKYLHGATSAAIFGEIICQERKEPIEQSLLASARDLTDEMQSNCPSLNENRQNLEKHIMKSLAKEAFVKYSHSKTQEDLITHAMQQNNKLPNLTGRSGRKTICSSVPSPILKPPPCPLDYMV
ncbi:Interferon-induced very large GTPase 1 [Labeo rohita]|uniref:Interferon-induced very large GTPase 1 n=1 Tax=Labeo rohita TaxID=84645 RepID=A0ABQ8L754_LABRO|nr:Interferon-induced very large GTPase 1 [Labeo rohita]